MSKIKYINKNPKIKGRFPVGNHYTDSNFNKVHLTSTQFMKLVKGFIKEELRRTPALNNFHHEVVCFLNGRGEWVYSHMVGNKIK